MRRLAVAMLLYALSVSFAQAGHPLVPVKEPPPPPQNPPNYVTLQADNRGNSQTVQGTTYAWGWFGAAPRSWFPPTCHRGQAKDTWIWYYTK